MPLRRTSAFGTRGRTAGTRRRQPFRRRRTSVATQARYRRSARAQSSQIQRLARIAVRNSRILSAQKLYTDYYLNAGTDATFTNGVWYARSVMDPISWQKTLRQNVDADEAQNAYIRNCFFQWTSSLYKLKSSAVMIIFLVSIRPNAANYVPSAGNLNDGEEFQNLGFYSMPVLNSGLMKVKFSKTFILQSNPLEAPSVAPTNVIAVGDPSDTYARGSVNIRVGQTFRSPSRFIAPNTDPTAWSDLSDTDLRPMQRLYFLAYFQSSDTENAAGLTWSAKFNVVTSN